MTKEELEKKRDQLYLEFRNDLIRICNFDENKSEDYAIIAQTMIPFKEGFDSAVALLLPRLEEAKLKAKFIEQYLNPADTSFRQMIDTFKSLSEDKKEKLINLTKSLVNMNEEK